MRAIAAYLEKERRGLADTPRSTRRQLDARVAARTPA